MADTLKVTHYSEGHGPLVSEVPIKNGEVLTLYSVSSALGDLGPLKEGFTLTIRREAD